MQIRHFFLIFVGNMKKRTSAGAWLVEVWLYLHGLLPLKYHYCWAGVIAWLLRDVFHYRSKVVLVNLSRSFPEKDYGEIQAIYKRFYRHLATLVVEMIWFSGCRGERGRRRFIRSGILRLSNTGEWNRISAANPQRMVMYTHMGNWELLGGIGQTSPDVPLDASVSQFVVVFLNLRSQMWNQVMEWVRTGPVCDQPFRGYVEAGDILRFVLRHRHEPFHYLFNTDQAPYLNSGSMTVEFLHQECRSMTGAAALACKLDMAAVYMRFLRREEGGYALTVVPLEDHAGATDPESLMKRYYQLLEEDLRQQPWNYLWTHRRWKKY